MGATGLSIADLYERAITASGQTITLRRPGTPATTINDVRARVLGDGTPEELSGGIAQKQLQAIVLAADVTFDPRLRPGDQMIYHGRTYTLASVDDASRWPYAFVVRT